MNSEMQFQYLQYSDGKLIRKIKVKTNGDYDLQATLADFRAFLLAVGYSFDGDLVITDGDDIKLALE